MRGGRREEGSWTSSRNSTLNVESAGEGDLGKWASFLKGDGPGEKGNSSGISFLRGEKFGKMGDSEISF